MKQILQQLRTGVMTISSTPVPPANRNQYLIQTTRSLISVGTEKMLVEFSRGNLLQKARSQPDKVKQVLEKIKTDGLVPTVEAVFNRLDEPLPLGYCNAGLVIELSGKRKAESGERTEDGERRLIGIQQSTSPRPSPQSGEGGLRPGDRVVSNGPHAEIVCVPHNLCAKIPDEVSDEEAAFTVLASIGLQGIRLAEPTLGEKFVVYGLGLIGLVTVQMLRTNGCEVLGIDLDPRRMEFAKAFGAEAASGADALETANAWTHGKGVDGVLITASANTDEILHNSAQMCRKRGRIVLVGVVGLNLKRSDFYEKELTFQVSCSYGPGRYDEAYEQKGLDYPYGFVRWTQQRNFEAVLEMMRTGRLDVKPLITHRFPFEQAPAAYDLITTDKSALGVILEYAGNPEMEGTIPIGRRLETADGRLGTASPSPISHLPSPVSELQTPISYAAAPAVIGVIGAGNFSKMTLMPGLSKAGARIAYVADLNGVAAGHLARKYGAEKATTDYKVILNDPAVNTVFVAVGHNLHARFVCEALAAGKHVFVEKPLAMNVDEVKQVLAACDRRLLTPALSSDEEERERRSAPHTPHWIMVGFNRRFSPHSVRIKEWLRGRAEPLAMTMTVNAGMIPPDHWVHDPVRGGGRIIGEACHFIDLMVFLAGSPVRTVSASMMAGGVRVQEDKMSISLAFEDGSVGTVNYFANGAKSYPKELIEVFSQGRVVRMENFRKTTGHGFKLLRRFKTWRQDKGHNAEFAAFIRQIEQGGPPLIPISELVNVTLASFAAMTAAREERTIRLSEEYGKLV